MVRFTAIGRAAAALSLALAGAALSGCYASDGLLLDPDQAVHPLADGVYVRQGDPADRFRLTLQPDGWYAVERIGAGGVLGETHRVLAQPSGDGLILAEQEPDGFLYGLARIEPGRLYLAAPDCADPLDRDDADDQGARPDDDDLTHHACRFTTRAALAAALAAFAGHADFGAGYGKG